MNQAKASFVRRYKPETQRLQAFTEIELESEASETESEADDTEPFVGESSISEVSSTTSEIETTNCEKDFYGCGALSPLETSKDTTAEEDSTNLDDSQQMAATSSTSGKLFYNLFGSLMLDGSNFDEYPTSADSSIDQENQKASEDDLNDISLSSIGLDFVSLDDDE